jgi:hypothetical protein
MELYEDPAFFRLLADNYSRFVGKQLGPENLSDEAAAKWLYEDAPFGVLSHNAADDPVFVYGNKLVQERFEYTWEELTRLPSRLSAEAPNREERQQFLNRVKRDGYSSGYTGVRVTKNGKRFLIRNATLWQLFDARGAFRGQAVVIPESVDIPA